MVDEFTYFCAFIGGILTGLGIAGLIMDPRR